VSPIVHTVVATPLESVVLEAGETDPPPDGTIHETATPAAGRPAAVTCTMAGTAAPTGAVRSVKMESAAMFNPLDDVELPDVGRDEGDVVSREHATAAQRAAAKMVDGRIAL